MNGEREGSGTKEVLTVGFWCGRARGGRSEIRETQRASGRSFVPWTRRGRAVTVEGYRPGDVLKCGH